MAASYPGPSSCAGQRESSFITSRPGEDRRGLEYRLETQLRGSWRALAQVSCVLRVLLGSSNNNEYDRHGCGVDRRPVMAAVDMDGSTVRYGTVLYILYGMYCPVTFCQDGCLANHAADAIFIYYPVE